jgi:two-component sensor histidine kinase
MIPKLSKININLDIKNIFLNLDTALPCGLIINELITNSADYAYPEQEGDINIKFSKKGKEYELIVEDFGIGFPDDFDFETNTESIDLYLVKNLVDQLNGTVNIDVTKGTKFVITFEELVYTDRF